MTILRACGVGILCICAVMAIRSVRADIAVIVGIAGAAVLFAMALTEMIPIVKFAQDISEETGFSVYVSTVLKAVGIVLLTQITSDICRDCGAGSVAGKIELCAKCAIISLAFPVIKSIIGLSEEILS